jgi:hypothetical protein
MIKEHDSVVLMQDLTGTSLKAGDVGTIVHVHQGGAGYEVEFVTLAGETITVATLLPSQIRAISRRDIPHVRELQDARTGRN